ncbi:MAG TPA: HAD-IA family hydrolase [Burkholderiales bacterium]
MKYRLLVFDWDGTIIDSPAAIVECIQEASRAMGLAVPSAEKASHVIGLGLRDSLQLAVPDLPGERYQEFVALYRRHFLQREDSMKVFSGIREILTEMKKDRLLAIATGKSRRGLDRALAYTGTGGFFTASRCADETQPKPHPAMLLELMEELAVERAQILMIGDTTHDLEMARAAEVDAIAVSYGAHEEEALRGCTSLACVSTVKQLSEWLRANA